VSGVAGSRRVVVAGVAGGVGTTTVTALLFTTLSGDSSPRLVDHSGGDLGARLTGGDDAGRVDRSLSLHDLGAHADGALIDLLAEPDVFGVVVGPTTEAGTADVRRVLEKVRERHGSGGLRRILVVVVGTFGQHATARAEEALQNEFGRRSLVVVPRDPALAAGGRVPLNRVNAESRRAQGTLASYLRERLVSHAGATTTAPPPVVPGLSPPAR
jgi:MinD-like ATPase involved in chromosome partitioning or flagellar assembly